MKRKCEICNSILDIEKHHVKAKSVGGEDIEENLIELCNFCHKLIHKLKIYRMDDIETLKEHGFSWWIYGEYIALEDLTKKHITQFGLQEMEFGSFILSLLKENKRANDLIKNGMRLAKDKGKQIGRPKAEFPQKWDENYKEWKQGNITAIEAMKRLNLKRCTFYNLVKKYEGGK